MTNGAGDAVEIQRRSLQGLGRMLARTARGSWAMQTDGVEAAVVRAAPHQPRVNSVTYSSAPRLLAGLDEIAAMYRSAGVHGWTVLVPESDGRASAGLQAAGYRKSERLQAMVLDLADFAMPRVAALDYDAGGDMRTLGRINEASYTSGHGLAAAFARWPEGIAVRVYQARADGEVACVLFTIDQPRSGGSSCAVYFVATVPKARGRGLATQLLSAALLEARLRGCVTSCLQASRMGAPVYARLGYRTPFYFDTYASP